MPPSYTGACWLFRKILGLIYLTAFVSLGLQITGLIGSQGILPAADFLKAVREQHGTSAYWDVPTVFWWASGDAALRIVCAAGAACSILLTLEIFPCGMLALAFVLYLSLVSAGQVFMGYQWDFLLLEAGFLAIFLKPTLVRVWLFQWLLFRLIFESGAVKLLSGDLTWHNLTAMAFHYQTQPLPTPLAWYMHQAPLWFQKDSTLFVFFAELVIPFLIFGSRRLRHVAAAVLFTLQLLIFLTGNYASFNLLTMALCILLLDDSILRWKRPEAGNANRFVTAGLFSSTLLLSSSQLAAMFGHPFPFPERIAALAAPFGVVNPYGLFANMTTTRLEIEIEGSNDGNRWSAYSFPFKPGDMKRTPPWVAPHQPRLDWQMWFAALGNHQQNPWFENLVGALLKGSPPVLALMERNPFPNAPPRYIRAQIYEYRFTDFSTRRATGAWWKRELKGTYFPAVSLNVAHALLRAVSKVQTGRIVYISCRAHGRHFWAWPGRTHARWKKEFNYS
ncbi:MAG: lipase maturation factor family protein [Acidobacteriota bacterium]|nr:lipase maturation factor family protein [Acidobacteriota bacterium]